MMEIHKGPSLAGPSLAGSSLAGLEVLHSAAHMSGRLEETGSEE